MAPVLSNAGLLSLVSGHPLPGGIPAGLIRASEDVSGLSPPVAGVRAPEDQFPGGPVVSFGLSPPVAGVQAPEDQFPGGPVVNLPFPSASPTVEIPTDQFDYPRNPARR